MTLDHCPARWDRSLLVLCRECITADLQLDGLQYFKRFANRREGFASLAPIDAILCDRNDLVEIGDGGSMPPRTIFDLSYPSGTIGLDNDS